MTKTYMITGNSVYGFAIEDLDGLFFDGFNWVSNRRDAIVFNTSAAAQAYAALFCTARSGR